MSPVMVHRANGPKRLIISAAVADLRAVLYTLSSDFNLETDCGDSWKGDCDLETVINTFAPMPVTLI